MSNDEIAGKLVVLEVFTMTALGLYLANVANDPDYSRSTALLDSLTNNVSQMALPLQPGAQRHAERYAAGLVTLIANNLHSLRGDVGRRQ